MPTLVVPETDGGRWWTGWEHLTAESTTLTVQLVDVGPVVGDLVAVEDGPGGEGLVLNRPELPRPGRPSSADAGALLWVPSSRILTVTIPYTHPVPDVARSAGM